MPPCDETRSKTLSELPPIVAENVLALAAVNKKWSRIPADVRDIVAQNMRRTTPSAQAFKDAFIPLPDMYRLDEGWIETQIDMLIEKQSPDSQWKTDYIWIINRESGYVSLHWHGYWVATSKRRKMTS